MKSDLSVTKKLTLSYQRDSEIWKRKCWDSRRECPEISGIPSSVSNKDLKDAVCKAIAKAGIKVSQKDIEDCHRVGKRGETIVKFCKRKIFIFTFIHNRKRFFLSHIYILLHK